MRKLLALLLIVASTAYADLGVIVTQSGLVIGKETYAGPATSWVAGSLVARQTADPTLSFQTFTLPNGTFDSTVIPINQTPLRASAVAYIATDPGPQNKVERAIMLITLSEINILRTALSLPPRTMAQLQAAIQAQINAGNAD